MSMSTKLAPVVVAGLGGVLIGWLLAPDIGAVRNDFAARFNEQTPLIQQLQASVASIEARMGQMPDADVLNTRMEESLAGLEGRLATQTEAAATRFGEVSGQTGEAMGATLEEMHGGIETLRGDVAGLREELAARAEAMMQDAPAPAPAEDEAGRLAAQIGATGAVLLPGQAAIFGGTRLDLSGLDLEAGTASVTPEGGEPQSVSEGETVDLSETCTVRLAGVASGAAYLAPENCTEAPAAPEVEAEQGAQAAPDQQPAQAEENAPNPGGQPPAQ
ncbi:hypothetical protein [Aureimonas populi]|uniref:Uncharacterized protein n=1 Tax=Aureimonas populi TaxID=1701758 RepID=A0ABW5CL42_9HYPH|nr:hypothetical protein [Aureimonas populi]